MHLGYSPRTGWAADPFGHSATMAYLLRRSGMTSMLIQRAHYGIKKYLAHRRQLQFFWCQSWGRFMLVADGSVFADCGSSALAVLFCCIAVVSALTLFMGQQKKVLFWGTRA